jgi:hypothetical protein
MLLTFRYKPAEHHAVRWNKLPVVRNRQSAEVWSVQIEIARINDTLQLASATRQESCTFSVVVTVPETLNV